MSPSFPGVRLAAFLTLTTLSLDVRAEQNFCGRPRHTGSEFLFCIVELWVIRNCVCVFF